MIRDTNRFVSSLFALIILVALTAGCCCTGGLDDDDIDLNLPGRTQPDLEPPVAAVSATPDLGVEPLEVQLDATDSYDTDGEIVQYDWDFDDDGTFDLLDGGATPEYTFASTATTSIKSVSFVETGQFTVTVLVTDNDGLTDEASTTVTTGELVPPVAVVSATPSNGVEPLDVQLDASASYDDDGTIVQYDWDFDGDGTFDLLDGGATPSYIYSSQASFSVSFVETAQFSATVRVTDDDGLTDEALTTVTIGELVPPTADLVPTPATGDTPLEVTWDASGSTDSDGTVEQYDWDMDNDGTFEIEDGGISQTVTYDPGGIYTVGVRVTDNDGLTDETTADVDVNNPPVADLVGIPASGTTPLDVTWDASGSTDSDGTIEQYDWDMDNDGTYEIIDGGDSQAATYPAFGPYTVGVMVTDDDGATDATTATVTALEPPVADLTATPAAGDAPINVTWDASGSTDADGTIVQYDWDMDNDGTFEISAGGASQMVNYPVGGIHTVGVMVTDNDGLTDQTTFAVDINNPPTADLQGSVVPNVNQEDWDVTWDASGSTDSDGTIVQYDWDLDNDGTFETLAGGATQLQVKQWDDYGPHTVSVRVTDDDGAQDEATATLTIFVDPIAILTVNPPTGILPQTVDFSASTSYDPDGGPIVQYDYDFDDDGIFELINQGPVLTFNYSIGEEYTGMVWVRVTDDEGATGVDAVLVSYTDPPT